MSRSNLHQATSFDIKSISKTSSNVKKIHAHLFEPERLTFKDVQEKTVGVDASGNSSKYVAADMEYDYSENGDGSGKGPLIVAFARVTSNYNSIKNRKRSLKNKAGEIIKEYELGLMQISIQWDNQDGEKKYLKRRFYPGDTSSDRVSMQEMIRLQCDPVDGFYAKLRKRLYELAYVIDGGNAKFKKIFEKNRAEVTDFTPQHPKNSQGDRDNSRPLTSFIEEEAYCYLENKDIKDAADAKVITKRCRITIPGPRGMPDTVLNHKQLERKRIVFEPVIKFGRFVATANLLSCKGNLISAVISDISEIQEIDYQADIIDEERENMELSHHAAMMQLISKSVSKLSREDDKPNVAFKEEKLPSSTTSELSEFKNSLDSDDSDQEN